MRASNLNFLPLRDDSPSSHSQRLIKLSATCGNPDTPGSPASDPTNETMNQQTEIL
jgi:hypothetical protein